MYIVFEGIVGTGKSTQSKLLTEFLQQRYPDKTVKYVREPGGSEIAEAIRVIAQGTTFNEAMDPICEAYLYAAARAQLLNTTVKDILNEGGIVVADRSVLSSLSNQGKARGVGLKRVMEINKEAIAECIPDVVLQLTCSLDYALQRTSDAAGDKFESMGEDFYRLVEAGYDEASALPLFSKQRHKIDASGSIEQVTERIHAVLSTYGVIN